MVHIFHSIPADGALRLTGDDAEHLKALRLRPGDGVSISDNLGSCAAGTIREIRQKEILLDVEPSRPAEPDSAFSVTLFQALLKGEKNEYVIQKSTELGITRIVFFPAARCVARYSDAEKKLLRWQKVARMAAMQCGRTFLPEVDYRISLAEALTEATAAELPILFYENATLPFSGQLNTLPSPPRQMAFFVGPEGGFSEAEADAAKNAGCHILSLGKRILRAETVPVAVLAAYRFYTGEM